MRSRGRVIFRRPYHSVWLSFFIHPREAGRSQQQPYLRSRLRLPLGRGFSFGRLVQIHDTVGFDQKSRPVCSARLGEPSPYHKIDLDPASYEAATAWWIDLASSGGEGMVAKPPDFIGKGRRGTIHPAIKCLEPEYLHIINGPEYLLPGNLDRLRSRGVGANRSLASREFALGLEALKRFGRHEPLRRTHECVFGVQSLESEPVDPRL